MRWFCVILVWDALSFAGTFRRIVMCDLLLEYCCAYSGERTAKAVGAAASRDKIADDPRADILLVFKSPKARLYATVPMYEYRDCLPISYVGFACACAVRRA